MKNKFLIISLLLLIGVFIACEKNEDETNNNNVEIIDCTTIKYQGNTFNINITPGAISFDIETMQNGNTGCFHIIASGGCIISATPISCSGF